MATDAAPLAVGVATLVARIVAVAGFGTAPGAVYRPDVEIVPLVVLPPVIPLTLHVTAVFDVPATVAVNCRVVDNVTLAEDGDTVTVTGA
jgi:hypothetical protein